MKLKNLSAFMACAICLMSCCTSAEIEVGTLTTPLDDSAWDSSMWISVVDAPVVEGKINGKNYLAADGASWFVSDLQNEGKVVSARWMAAGLGVFELYVNGQRVGNEFLKPGFTHNQKTKYSFTYDITEAVKTGSGAENVFAAHHCRSVL